MSHFTQMNRLANLKKVNEWVQEEIKGGKKPVEIDRLALARKAVLGLGCTRSTAMEYIKEVLGE